MGTGSLEQENLWGKADGSKSHTAFIPVIELPRIPAECLKDEIIVEAARRIDYELMYGRNSISEDDDGAYSNSYIDISDIS